MPAGLEWQNIIIRAIIDRGISLIFKKHQQELLELHRTWQTGNNFPSEEMFSLDRIF